MTRKRAVKLLMARGYSRNQAVRHFRAKPDGMCNFDWLLLRVAVSNLRRDVVIKDEAREWARDSQRIRRLIEWGVAMYNCTVVLARVDKDDFESCEVHGNVSAQCLGRQKKERVID